MDGWGSLTMLIKRQLASRKRKENFQFDLQKKKENLLKNSSITELEFPVISDSKMKLIKKKIKKKYKTERIKDIILYVIITIFTISFVTFIMYS